jgi:hypothetical protein
LGRQYQHEGLFTPSDAPPASVNQRELLAANMGLKTLLLLAITLYVKLISDSQVSLAVIKKWTCRLPRIMVLLWILRVRSRSLCEENGISLGLHYTPSLFNIWDDKLSRCRLSPDWALTPSSLAQIRLSVARLIQFCSFCRTKGTLSLTKSRNRFVLKIQRTSCLRMALCCLESGSIELQLAKCCTPTVIEAFDVRWTTFC